MEDKTHIKPKGSILHRRWGNEYCQTNNADAYIFPVLTIHMRRGFALDRSDCTSMGMHLLVSKSRRCMHPIAPRLDEYMRSYIERSSPFLRLCGRDYFQDELFCFRARAETTIRTAKNRASAGMTTDASSRREPLQSVNGV